MDNSNNNDSHYQGRIYNQIYNIRSAGTTNIFAACGVCGQQMREISSGTLTVDPLGCHPCSLISQMSCIDLADS